MSKSINETKYLNDTNSRKNNILFHIYVRIFCLRLARKDLYILIECYTEKRDSYGEVTFFIGPVMILLISNVVFFVLTSIHCNKVKAEIKRVTINPTDPRNKRFHSDRKR